MTKHLPTASLLCPEIEDTSAELLQTSVESPLTSDDCRMHHPWRCIEVWPEASKIHSHDIQAIRIQPDAPNVANCEY